MKLHCIMQLFDLAMEATIFLVPRCTADVNAFKIFLLCPEPTIIDHLLV